MLISGFLTIAVDATKPTSRIPRVIKLMGSIKPFFMADNITITAFLAIDNVLLVIENDNVWNLPQE